MENTKEKDKPRFVCVYQLEDEFKKNYGKIVSASIQKILLKLNEKVPKN
jgi:hypothetical protein